MASRRPTVWETGATHRLALEDTILLDTPAWLTWLDDPATTSFAFPVHNRVQGYIEGFMTLRKEHRQRGGPYWTAYWRVQGRVRKVYLGASTAVTAARLRAIAAGWLALAPDSSPGRAAH
jgi:hypothetical protein